MYLWASSKTTSLLNLLPPVGGFGEHLEKHDEEPQRLVLFDELVSQIDDHEAPRAQDVRQPVGVVDVLLREAQPEQCKLFQVLGKPGVPDALAKRIQGDLAAQLLHDECELPDVHALAADRTHQELPV